MAITGCEINFSIDHFAATLVGRVVEPGIPDHKLIRGSSQISMAWLLCWTEILAAFFDAINHEFLNLPLSSKRTFRIQVLIHNPEDLPSLVNYSCAKFFESHRNYWWKFNLNGLNSFYTFRPYIYPPYKSYTPEKLKFLKGSNHRYHASLSINLLTGVEHLCRYISNHD